MIITSRLSLVLTLALSIALSGCATLFSGSTQTINVKIVESGSDNALEGVSCIVAHPNGNTWTLPGNPGILTVDRGNGAIQISCKKAGYRQLNMAVGDGFNAVTVVNILFWPGFIVDALSGSYKKYPSHYLITMQKPTLAK